MSKRFTCLLALVLSSSASAQRPSVGPARAVLANPDPSAAYMETVVAASELYPNEVLAAAIIRYVEPNGAFRAAISYGVSLNAGTSFTNGILHPLDCLPQWAGGDPMVAVAPDGKLYLGGLTRAGVGNSGYYVAQRREGSAGLDPVVTALCSSTLVDKPLMAYGPSAGVNSLFVAITSNVTGGLVGKRSDDPYGQSWVSPEFDLESAAGVDIVGFGAFPVILPSGRTIVAVLNQNTSNSVQFTRKDPSQPYWSVPVDINFPAPIPPILPIDDGVLPGGFLALSFPSVAVDPRNPSLVYVAFAGYVDGSTDVDLYIALSINAGETFEASRILRLTNAQLGATDQFMPAIAVDQYGGINLLYYRTSSDDNVPSESAMLQAAYARIASFAVPLPSPPHVSALSRTFPAVVWPVTTANVKPIGEYQWIVAAGCNVYPCYMSTLDPYVDVLRYNYFVHQISICPSDANDNGFTDSGDPAAFAAAYVAGSSSADLNQDQVVNASDIAVFQNAYACGCLPP